MSPNSTPQGKCYSFGEIEHALLAIGVFIEHRRWTSDPGDCPYGKHDCDNVCDDVETYKLIQRQV